LSDADAKKNNEPRLLGVDNAVVVPVNRVIKVETAGADVIHSWALPQMGVKMDAVPGRINETWFKATKTGTYYGECSELCGARHAFMPIEVKVVSDAEYAAWLETAKKKFAAIDGGGASRLAAK
jgi:cytochrome c oxidase subunit 2